LFNGPTNVNVRGAQLNIIYNLPGLHKSR